MKQTEMPPPVLSVRRLSIARDGTRIIRGLNWTVEPGSHWAVIGANGSGKTTLLGSLLGYFPPSSGTVSVLGETYGEHDWRELRRRIGIVSSSVRQLVDEVEPAELVVLAGKEAMINHWGRIRPADLRRAQALLRLVDAGSLASRPWAYLSQGERQRVLIARALMADPVLLILDEPCAGLDPLARETFLNFLRRLARAAAAPSIVFVTHHVEEIVPEMTHVLLLRRGAALAQGPKRQVLTAAMLGRTFGTKVSLNKKAGRHWMQVAPLKGKAA